MITGSALSMPTLVYRPERFVADVQVQLTAESGRGGQTNWDDRLPSAWKKEVYRFAVIPVEYPDVKHSDKVTTADWSDAFLSTGTYSGTNRHGQSVFGSMNDYFREQSFGKLRVEGKVFDWVEVSKKRMDYQQGTNKAPFLTEALDKLLAREGKEALKDFDGLLFMYAGGRVQTNRGALYWPHRASFTHQGKRWSYFIVGEGGDRMANISVFCHEFGHMLGLPDLYARPENPGSEGLGAWCAMSNQAGNGRPQHFSAWCKEQLGWIDPVLIDPTVRQKLILAPIEDSPKECFKVLVKPDGSEYLLLENRAKRGFDESIPAEGLLIWRVVQRRPILEESHGVDGPSGPRVFSNSVPYPSAANNSFTPYTTPSSRSQLGGGLPVFITNIRKLADGRVAFELGYDYQ
jgi:M6 family metalloprotease-like protein